ncbi:MAG: hypothetical protein Q9214_004390 [Letrouitia sp. 1 TL-2023]
MSDLRDLSDPTMSLCNINLWSFVEPGCALIGTCLPTLKPLLPQRFRGVTVPSPRTRKYLRDENSTDQYDLRQWKSHISVEPKRPNASKAEGFKKLDEKDMHDNGELGAIRPGTGHGPGTAPLITTQIEIRSDDLPSGIRSMGKLGSIA